MITKNCYCIYLLHDNYKPRIYQYHKGYDATGPFFKVTAAIFAVILLQNKSLCVYDPKCIVLSKLVYLDRCEEPVEGLRPVVGEHDDPEGGDGGEEGGADDVGLTQGDGGHELHGKLLTPSSLSLSSEAKI